MSVLRKAILHLVARNRRVLGDGDAVRAGRREAF